MRTQLTINQCKTLVKNYLDERQLPYRKITARTVHFDDLARDRGIFVTVHGWKGDPAWQGLRLLAYDNDFCVESRS